MASPFAVAFSNLGYTPDAGKYCGKNFVNPQAAGALDGVTIIASGLYAATLTDQFAPSGWTAGSGNEVNRCTWTSSGPGADQNIVLPTGTFAVQSIWANDGNGGSGGCEISHPTVTNGPDLVTESDPGNQSSPMGTALLLPIVASDSGGAALTYTATGLPPGLSIGAATGVISGTPTAYATSAVTVTAADAAGASYTVTFTWATYPATAPVITSANRVTFTVGVNAVFTITTTGNPAPDIMAEGKLPTGMWITDNHDATATLTAQGGSATRSGGVYHVTLTASYRGSNATTQTFTVTVNEAPGISSAAFATFPVGVARSMTVTTWGFPTPSLVVTGALPAGVTFNPATDILGGTAQPGQSGTYPLTFTATNAIGPPASQNFTLTINQVAMTYPTAGQQNVDTTRPFTWSTVPDALYYQFLVGTKPGIGDLVFTRYLPVTQSSYNVPALPVGPTLFITLIAALQSGGQTFQSVGFTAAPGQASFTFPLTGQTNVDTSRAFTWSAISQAQGYILVVGTKQFGTNLVNSGVLPATQSSYLTPILPAGVNLYATLLTEVNGVFSRFQSIVFTAEPGMGILTSGIGLIFNGPPTTFTWSTIAGAQNYILVVGTTQFGTNVINSGLLPATQSSYSSFPPLSRNMIYYVTLLTKVDGQWAFYANVLGT